MELDPLESAQQGESGKPSRLNSVVAVTVALLATYLGICKVNDDNICQSMQKAQAASLDAWSTFHSKSTEAKVLSSSADQLELLSASLTGPTAAKAQAAIKRSRDKAQEELSEKSEWKDAAEKAEKEYDALNYKDDQFDLSDTLSAIAISMLAVTALTQKRWLFWVAMVPTALAVVMGVAGLAGLKIHPDAISNLLSVLM